MNTLHNEVLKKDPTLKKIVDLLIRLYAPERIYLFGSKARGDSHSQSDYDLMVIVEQKPKWKPGPKKGVHRTMWDAGVQEAADILVWTKKNFDSRLHLKASLPATVVEEGELLYAA